MKKILFMSAALVLLGGACVTVDISNNSISVPQSVTAYDGATVAHVLWSNDAYLGCMTLGVSKEVAAAIGYPDGPTDHLCVTEESRYLVSADRTVDLQGQAVLLLNDFVSPESANPLGQGNVYRVNVVEVLE